jgi:hypothetical protein
MYIHFCYVKTLFRRSYFHPEDGGSRFLQNVCDQQDYATEKFQWHHRKSKPRPAGL